MALAEIATASVKAEAQEARTSSRFKPPRRRGRAKIEPPTRRVPRVPRTDPEPRRRDDSRRRDSDDCDAFRDSDDNDAAGAEGGTRELDRARAQLHDALGESRAAREALAASERRAKVAEGAAKSAAERIRAEAESRVRAAEVAAEMRVATAREEAAEGGGDGAPRPRNVELERDRAERAMPFVPRVATVTCWNPGRNARTRLRRRTNAFASADAARVTETAEYGVAFAAMASATTATERGDLLAATCAATAHALEFATRVVRDGNRTGGWMAAAETRADRTARRPRTPRRPRGDAVD